MEKELQQAIANANRLRRELPNLVQPSQTDRHMVLLHNYIKELVAGHHSLTAELDRPRAAVAELERDAARFRFLSALIKYRDEPDAMTRAYMNWEVEVSSMAPATLGEAIDAAMEAANVPD